MHVSNMRRAKRLVALAAGLSLVAMACGGDDDDDGTTATTAGEEEGTETTTAATEAPEGTEAPSDTTAAGGGEGEEEGAAPAGDVAMTITVNLNPDAVWEDGTPITVADLECTWQAQLESTGSIETVGYDKIISVSEGESDKQAIIEFSEPYGPYKTLFYKIIKADYVEDCTDISADFATEMPISARQYKLQEWSETQSIMVANENYWGDDPAVTPEVVMVPQTDTDTEIASILAGQVDYIFPQLSDQVGSSLQAANLEQSIENGNDFEALYFQQLEGPFADPVFRDAFSKSIDRQALFDQIYAPIFTSAGEQGELLNCGPIVQGPYCPPDNFQDTYDPAAAEALLTEAGWEKDGAGFWAKDGVAPEIRWMVNAGNTRRENTQAYLIPLLAQAGFNVVPSNGTAEEVFQQRLPALDYDFAMYISDRPSGPGLPHARLDLRQHPDRGEQLPGSEPAGLVQRRGHGSPLRSRSGD